MTHKHGDFKSEPKMPRVLKKLTKKTKAKAASRKPGPTRIIQGDPTPVTGGRGVPSRLLAIITPNSRAPGVHPN